MSDELPGNLRPVADFFGLPGTAPVAKDFHVVRAIRVLAALDAAPFALVFGGGTALARAHRLVRRMSEDVAFKIVAGYGTGPWLTRRRCRARGRSPGSITSRPTRTPRSATTRSPPSSGISAVLHQPDHQLGEPPGRAGRHPPGGTGHLCAAHGISEGLG